MVADGEHFATAIGLRRLAAGHAEDNPASGRVLQKLGFLKTGERNIWSSPRGLSITQVVYGVDLPQTNSGHSAISSR